MAFGAARGHLSPMNKKRAVAAILWFFAVWTAWSFGAFAFGLPDIGPILGLIAGAVITGSGRLWDVAAAQPADARVALADLHQLPGAQA